LLETVVVDSEADDDDDFDEKNVKLDDDTVAAVAPDRRNDRRLVFNDVAVKNRMDWTTVGEDKRLVSVTRMMMNVVTDAVVGFAFDDDEDGVGARKRGVIFIQLMTAGCD